MPSLCLPYMAAAYLDCWCFADTEYQLLGYLVYMYKIKDDLMKKNEVLGNLPTLFVTILQSYPQSCGQEYFLCY
jgi:hypothetical protein